jgi:crossover junction endonuclease MUS81
LIQLAQPHCDSSFAAPSDPTKFFTAWNSIKTLLEKDLVFERGRPLRKYALTEEGWEVARRIKRAEASEEGSLGAVPTCVGGKDEGHWVGIGPTRVWVESEIPSSHGKENQPPRPRNQQEDVLSSKSITTVPTPLNARNSAASREPQGAQKNKFSWRKVTARQDTISNQEGSDQDDDFVRISSSSPQQAPEQLAHGWHSIDSICDPTHPPDVGVTSVQQSNSQEGPKKLPSFKPIFLPNGSFTVQLVLDTREIRTKTDRDYMQEELAKKGVSPIVRSLELGDALWVAKCHDSRALEAYGEEGDEVMLDWIVERKRLDDLVGSIKDGRFQEQKVSSS